MVFYLVLIAILVFLFFCLSMIWPPDSPWAPWWRTSKKTSRAMCRLAKVSSKDVIYDLGSGEGVTLSVAAEEFGAKGVGIEIDPLRYFLSKLKLRNKDVEIKRSNFFNEDFSKASVIFAYLVPKTLNRLIPKMKKELKKGTRIVTYRYEMKLPLKKEDKENELFLYEI